MTTPRSQFQLGPGTTLSLSGRWLLLGCTKTKPNTKHQNTKPDLILTQNSKLRKIRCKPSQRFFEDRLCCKRMRVPNFRHGKQALKKKKSNTQVSALRNIFVQSTNILWGKRKSADLEPLIFFYFFEHVIFISLFCFCYFFPSLTAYKTSKQKSLWNKIEP